MFGNLIFTWSNFQPTMLVCKRVRYPPKKNHIALTVRKSFESMVFCFFRGVPHGVLEKLKCPLKNAILAISCSNHQFSRGMLVFRGVSRAIHSYDGCYPRWFKVVSIFQKMIKRVDPTKTQEPKFSETLSGTRNGGYENVCKL